MERIPFWVISISLLLLVYSANSEQDDVKVSLISFLRKLAPNNIQIDSDLGWNRSSDPCLGGWTGVTCNNRTNSVRTIALEGLGLDGSIDASLLCNAQSLMVLSLRDDSLQGGIPDEISNCTQLTHLYLNGNRLSGSLPSSLTRLKNLKRLDISNNNFSGELPDLNIISGLVTFFAQSNHLNGTIPQFDFTNLQQFNVSYNNFTGPIPDVGDRFSKTSFLGNYGLCGAPFLGACPPTPSPPPSDGKSKSSSGEQAIMFSGYIILGLVFVFFFVYMLFCRKKAKTNNGDGEKKASDSTGKPNSASSGSKTGASRSEYSISSSESAMRSSSLVVLKNRMTKELNFDDLLKAPAELLGRGRFGSLYKVMFADGSNLAVKRIKDWTISAEDFHKRMERIDRLKHPNVMSAVAFYCSKQEKLVVYEYQQNGSLFKLLHGTQSNQTFDWGSRLSVAACISEGLAFMHKELSEYGIGHGNLKSSNIMLDKNMDPCISEYGLLVVDNQNLPPLRSSSNGNKSMTRIRSSTMDTITSDVYGFGVILLELLTGKLVQNNGFDLATWVHSVVREEWTVEVFDKVLISDGASEESMVQLLQVALKCINPSPDARPSMNQVATMINTIKEEEERSIVSEI